jgi:hypothetical protein
MADMTKGMVSHRLKIPRLLKNKARVRTRDMSEV